jgi:hypothetical protein
MFDSPNGHHRSKRWWRKTKTGSLTMAQMHSSATEHALENQRTDPSILGDVLSLGLERGIIKV